jgi:hypothetical protein
MGAESAVDSVFIEEKEIFTGALCNQRQSFFGERGFSGAGVTGK